MKILSMMWYSDDDAMAMIAGIAYRARSLPSESVPSDTVLFCTDDIYYLFEGGRSYDRAVVDYLCVDHNVACCAHRGR